MANDRPSQPRDLFPGGAKKAVAPAKPSDGRTTYAAGDELFRQGDHGGDLYFIEQGTIEIFTEKEGETIILSEMNSGEIIGIMTCLNGEPRMASARAKTEVVCKRVPHTRIKRVIDALPNWMKIVIKEFTIRLTQMNKIYTDAALRIKRLEASQVNAVYQGAQVASAFGAIAEFMGRNDNFQRFVVLEDVVAKLEHVLNFRKEEVDRLFRVIVDAGLLKIEVEPQSKRQVAKVEDAQKLVFFAQFVRESRHGATRKLVRARFTNRETRVLSAVVKLALRLDLDMDKTCRLAVAELERSLERITGVRFERAALDKAMTMKLLAIDSDGEQEYVVLKPGHLGRTVACVEAVRKLSAMDQSRQKMRGAA